MQKKIIIMGDYFYNSPEHVMKDSFWLHKSFLPMLKKAVNEDIEITFSIEDDNANKFSREYFYKLNGIDSIKESYNQYDVSQFSEKQIEYLKRFFNKNTIIIGFELYNKLSCYLTRFGCQIIDIAFHPFKLFDDLTLGFYTNNKSVYNQLLKYQIPQDKFYYYANYWKVFMEYNNMISDKDISSNSVVFIGQTLADKSVEKNGKFLNVMDYAEKIKELKQQYSNIYYLPHPYLGKGGKIIHKWINENPNIELLDKCSTYGLLASDKIKKVIGISASVLYEAQYFNKEIEYLYKPLFEIDLPFERNSYISILDDYYSPKFWADILSPICNVKTNLEPVNYFKPAHNKMRDLKNAYWGYAQLDSIKRLENSVRMKKKKNFISKTLLPLFFNVKTKN